MKKVILLMMVAVLGMATANAQYYLGGSVGFSSNSSKPEGGEKTTSTAFEIIPEFGYSLTDKLDLGIALGYTSDEDELDNKVTGFGVNPYVRYSLVSFGNFSVLGKAGLVFETEKAGDLKTTTFGLTVMPMLKYTLSDKFDLLANLNFMRLGFASASAKFDGTKLGTETGFGLGVDTNDVANIGGGDVPFTIGFAFKF